MMAHEWEAPDEYLIVREIDGELWQCDPSDEPRVDAAVTRWVDSGRTMDTVLMLTQTEGAPVKLLASRVSSWWVFDQEFRRRNMLREVAQKDAVRTLRADLGLPYKEED